MSILPPEVHAELTQLLQALQSPDNNIRSQAEEHLQNSWTNTRPEILLMGLAEQIQAGSDTPVCSVLYLPCLPVLPAMGIACLMAMPARIFFWSLELTRHVSSPRPSRTRCVLLPPSSSVESHPRRAKMKKVKPSTPSSPWPETRPPLFARSCLNLWLATLIAP